MEHPQLQLFAAVAPRPELDGLGLAADELEALKRQGTITSERGRSGAVVFKLRFRLHRKQRVLYLGGCVARIERLKLELIQLQQPRRLELQLGKLRHHARRMLRDVQAATRRELEPAGYRLHGHAIRRKQK